MEGLDPHVLRDIRIAVYRGTSYLDIAQILQRRFPTMRGLSEKSVRRYCKRSNISKINDYELDEGIGRAILEVGPTYGRRMMVGYLRAHGLSVGRKRVAKSLARVDPDNYNIRRTCTGDRTNPRLYTAHYYGHKIHLDQNEKLGMYGVTHICARDGFSGRIVGLITIPCKCNFEIIDKLFRPLLLREGLWTQVRVDQGSEFVLTTFLQDCLAEHRPEQNCPAWIATSSEHNLRIERIWPEVNQRVNYPLKRIVVTMQEQGMIHMQDNVDRFCVSMVLIKVAKIGIERFVSSWNNHNTRASVGRPGATGTPEECFERHNGAASIRHLNLPTTEEIKLIYQQRGGRIESWGKFGWDPIADDVRLVQERQHRMEINFPTYEHCFNSAVHGDHRPL